MRRTTKRAKTGTSRSKAAGTTSRKKASSTRRGAKAKPKKYGSGVGKKVAKVLHEQKQGELRSGRSGKKVTSRKQAIAIALSEARAKGEKVPPKRAAKRTSRRTSTGSRPAHASR